VLPLNAIYPGNCLDLIECVDDASVDLVFYSPPYFDLHKYGKTEGEIGHGQDMETYLRDMAALNRACARVLKPTGNLVINVMDLVRENRPVPLADMLVKDVAEQLLLIQKIVWFIVNKMPVASPKRFCNKFEWILHLAKTDDYVFNLDAVREPHGKWGAIDAKKRPEKWNPLGKNPGNDWNFPLEDDDGIQAGRRDDPESDHWDIKAHRVAGKHKLHKAAFPLSLAERAVKCWSPEGGVVLDPFVGSGTTCVAAQKHGRAWLGFELHEENVQTAQARLRGELGPI
jgi:DNA modification methylase